MPSDGRCRLHTSWRYQLHPPTITIDPNRVSPEATRPPAPYKVSIDFQHSLEIRCRILPDSSTIVERGLNTDSVVYKKDAGVFCDARSAERTINEMFFSTPSWWFMPSIWRVPMVHDVAARIFAVVSNIYNEHRQDVALISFVLVVTKVVHVTVLDTNLAFQQSFEAAQQAVSVRPAPPELLESLVTEECAAAEGESDECMICLEELNVRVDVKRLPCSHRFHGDCILRWFTEKDFCPLCRYTYVPSRK